MKSIKEKAEAYDKVLEWATEAHKVCDGMLKEDLEHLFPELKESEDERIRGNIIATIHLYYGEPLEDEAKEMIEWLERQGEKKPLGFNIGDEITVNGQICKVVAVEQKPAWSEEDEINLGKAIWYVENPAPMVAKDSMLVEWLKNLRGRVQPQHKQEWSEEDENRINHLIAFFEDKKSITAKDDIVYANWLKSLKDRYTWKPSEEQLHGLDIASTTLRCQHNAVIKGLDSLYMDLKKLKD